MTKKFDEFINEVQIAGKNVERARANPILKQTLDNMRDEFLEDWPGDEVDKSVERFVDAFHTWKFGCWVTAKELGLDPNAYVESRLGEALGKTA
jgi:hypothetical protein